MRRIVQQKVIGATAGNAVAAWVNDQKVPMKVNHAELRLTTNATVANRYGTLTIKNASGTAVYSTHAGAPVTASLTNQHFQFMPGIYRETAIANGAVQVPIPQELIVPPGWSAEFSILNGVAGDSWTCDAFFSELK